MSDLYGQYTVYKQWSGDAPAPVHEDYSYLVDIANCKPSDRILEIGFGAGHFMDWARNNGFHVVGTEILPEMIAAARNRGHVVMDDMFSPTDQKFDVIIAIDVLEHIPQDGLRNMLERIRQLLAPGGRLVARFPNGDSPFNGRYQNGDATHLKPLSATSLAQVAIGTGMTVNRVMNPRPLPAATLPKLKRKFMYRVRDVIETIIGRAYFGDRFPMDPNILVILKPV
jgi:SAM-dependent methyltransferase